MVRVAVPDHAAWAMVDQICESMTGSEVPSTVSFRAVSFLPEADEMISAEIQSA